MQVPDDYIRYCLLLERLENLVKSLIRLHLERTKKAEDEEAELDWVRGFDRGSANAYELSAQWICREANIDYTTLYQEVLQRKEEIA